MKKSNLIASAIIGIVFALAVVVILIATGALGQEPEKLIFTSGSAEKTYDGSPLTSSEWVLSSGELKDGHRADVKLLGTQTETGESKNLMSVTIYDSSNNDVTKNYDIECQYGSLRVTPILIAVQSESAEKTYDGEPLVGNSVSMVAGYLLTGHKISFEATGSQTYVGESPNEFKASVVDRSGADVTRNYTVVPICGTLKVNPIKLTIRTGSDSKSYDGTPLTNDGWELMNEEALLDGHTIEELVLSGTITDPGQTENTIESIKITDENGIDVSANYDISDSQLGILKVVDPSAGGGNGGDGGDGGDGDGGSGGAGTGAGKPPKETGIGGTGGPGSANEADLETVIAKIKTAVSYAHYLRQASYGAYTGKGWNEAPEYTELINGTHSALYLSGLALENSGIDSIPIDIMLLGAYYMYPTYLDTDLLNYKIQASDAYNDGNESTMSEMYSAYYYAYSYAMQNGSVGTVPSEYSEYEAAYRQFVYDNYLEVPSSTDRYLQALIATQGFANYEKGSSEQILAVAAYIQASAVYNMEYNPALDNEDDIVVAFLSKYKEGICQHYASAATLMFRSLGIPARYTVGYAVASSENEWTDVKVGDGHAWVEIYIDGFGWSAIEVTGGGAGSTIPSPTPTPSPNPNPNPNPNPQPTPPTEITDITVTPHKQYHKYDGNEFTVSKYNEKGELLAFLDKDASTYFSLMNYTFDCELNGTYTEVGYWDITVSNFVIYDENGQNITEQFNVTFKTDKLQIYEIELFVISGSASKTYDGTPLTNSDYELSHELLDPTHSIKIEFKGSITNAGVSDNSFTASVVDADGNNAGARYRVRYQYGKLTVNKRVIEITAGSAMKQYDGTPLTCDEYEITEGELCVGHTLFVEMQGELTEYGEISNTVDVETIIIMDTRGTTVTSNYIIRNIDGTLIVYYGSVPPDVDW